MEDDEVAALGSQIGACKICKKPYWSLQRHNQTHHYTIKCEFCQEKLSNDRDYKNHMQDEHKDFVLGFRCKNCSARYTSKELLDLHQSNMHSPHLPLECYKCGIQCRTKFDLRKHMVSQHSNLKLSAKMYDAAMEACPSCGKRTRDMFVHYREHHWPDAQPFECNICQKRFKSRHKIKLHMKNHSNVRNLHCMYCPRTFMHHTSLKRHSVIHSDHLQYQCEMCGLNFRHSTTLKLHMKSHTGEKPFKCDMCENAYTTSVSLKMHRRIHLNERPYKCEYCEAAFYDNSTLTVHRRQHSGENPFICHLCRKSCKQASNLKSHYKHVHKDVFITGQQIRNNARIFALYSAEELRTGDLIRMLQETGPCAVTRGRQPNTPRIWPIATKSQQVKMEQQPGFEQCIRSSSSILELERIQELQELQVEPILVDDSGEFVELKVEETIIEDVAESHQLHENNDDNYANGSDSEISIVPYDENLDADESDYESKTFEPDHIEVASASIPSDSKAMKIKVETTEYSITQVFPDQNNVQPQPLHLNALPKIEPVTIEPSHTNHKPAVVKKSANEPKSFECYICKTPFKRSKNLRGHMRQMHLPKRHMCHVCGSAFATSNAFRRHLMSHSDDRPFICPTCQRSFKSQQSLAIHTKTHTQEKRFVCDVCSKTFHTTTGIKLHARTHTGEKPFACEFCAARFSDPSIFRQHRRIHTGELPYRCHLCGKGCTQVGNLKSHLRHYHKINVAHVPLSALNTLKEPPRF